MSALAIMTAESKTDRETGFDYVADISLCRKDWSCKANTDCVSYIMWTQYPDCFKNVEGTGPLQEITYICCKKGASNLLRKNTSG